MPPTIDHPGPELAPRPGTSPGRTEAIELYLRPPDDSPARRCVRKAWLLVAVRSSEGLLSWGEDFTLWHRTTALVGMLRDLERFVLGMDAADRCGITAKILQDFAEQDGGPDLHAALSVLDQALWDLLGNALHAPVSQLLGVVPETEFACYANVGSNRHQPLSAPVDRAAAYSEEGYAAVKLYPMYHDTGETAAIALMRAVRESVAPDCEIIVDFWRLRRPDEVLRILRSANDPRVWVDDPLRMDKLQSLAELNLQLGFCVASGETESGLRAFRPLLEQQAVGALSPDVALCRGITALRRVADLAHSYAIALMPHCHCPDAALLRWACLGGGHARGRGRTPAFQVHGDPPWLVRRRRGHCDQPAARHPRQAPHAQRPRAGVGGGPVLSGAILTGVNQTGEIYP